MSNLEVSPTETDVLKHPRVTATGTGGYLITSAGGTLLVGHVPPAGYAVCYATDDTGTILEGSQSHLVHESVKWALQQPQ